MCQLKKDLYRQCADYVQQRMNAAMTAIEEAQKASNDDTKSSAGDKYETGRAMMQQEKDRNAIQLNEANKLRVVLNRISTDAVTNQGEEGSVITTDHGNFYLAIGAGELMVNGTSYIAISQASPIGMKLKGKTQGEEIEVNSKLYHIIAVI